MKGFVPTPPGLVDAMVEKLFRRRQPSAGDRLLDPGCGTGAFIEGVLRWCRRHSARSPEIVGVDSDAHLLAHAKERLNGANAVTLLQEDFLLSTSDQFDFIIGNPPYVPITGLSVEERRLYRQTYATARGRFDLYLLFFEKALRLLKPTGRLVFVTPEKFLYVQTASPLRKRLAEFDVEEIELVQEEAFAGLVTYPTVTTVNGPGSSTKTLAVLRDGTERTIRLSKGGQSWTSLLNGHNTVPSATTLAAAFTRISCGVATGADEVYVIPDTELRSGLSRFAFPTVAGREIQRNQLTTRRSMLVPYASDGRLLSEVELGELGDFLRSPTRKARLLQRTCVLRKPWYAFHENPPLKDILKPKILCKDISSEPWFIADETGCIVPRHSVYYLVPKNPHDLHTLCDFLNSPEAAEWLKSHCQRAANGFYRLQSHILKELPLPTELAREEQLAAV